MTTDEFEIYRFDRLGEPMGSLGLLLDEARTEEVNGEDSLSVTCTGEVEKYDTLVACDREGRWHEWRVTDVALRRSGGVPVRVAYATSSLEETALDYIEDSRPGVRSPTTCSACLDAALAPTRWARGEVGVSGLGGVMMYHTNALSALRAVVQAFGGELRATVEVDGARVSARRVDVLARLGRDSGKRFEYAKDVADITRTVDSSEVVTALYAWGKGEQSGDGYGRRVGIAGVNGGVPYVADEQARLLWGRPDGKGGMAHRFGEYVDEQCEDPAELKAGAEADLARRKAPKVSYALKAVDLSAYGMEWEGTSLGDGVAITDDELGVEASGRVTRIRWRDLEPSKTEVTIGNVVDGIDSIVAAQEARWASVAKAMARWDDAASASEPYIELLRQGINRVFEESGSYVYQSPELGLVTSSVPLDERMRPQDTPFYAVQVARGMARFSCEVDGAGEPVWTTWFNGKGVVADAINAGKIVGGANSWDLETGDLVFEQGVIQSANGRFFLNMTTGDFSLQGIASADEAIKAVDVEYALGTSATAAPTSGWSTSAPEWQAGRYMWSRTKAVTGSGAVSYSAPTCIQGAAGKDGEPGDKGDTGAAGKGVSAIVEQYYLSTSSSAQSGGSWSAAQPTWQSGRHIWTRSVVTWSDGTTTHTSPVLARALTGANEAASAAKSSAKAVEDKMNPQGIFNALTNNGQDQGIYMRNGKIYLNGEYMKINSIDADKIDVDSLRVKKIYNTDGSSWGEIGDFGYNGTIIGKGFRYIDGGTELMALGAVKYIGGSVAVRLAAGSGAAQRTLLSINDDWLSLCTINDHNADKSGAQLQATESVFNYYAYNQSNKTRLSLWFDSSGLHMQRTVNGTVTGSKNIYFE